MVRDNSQTTIEECSLYYIILFREMNRSSRDIEKDKNIRRTRKINGKCKKITLKPEITAIVSKFKKLSDLPRVVILEI